MTPAPSGEDAETRPQRDRAEKPSQPYGQSENYGSPGGDEPPASTDPGSGSASDASGRHEKPETK